jgi:hypothetical protein
MNHLTIITAYTSNIQELSDLSYDSLIRYGTKHNIPVVRQLLTNPTRPASWHKIECILNTLEYSNYVMWIDCDTTIIDYDFNITEMLDESEIYVSRDINGINCGIMIWRNTPRTLEILNKIWSMTEFLNHQWWEQAAFHKLYDDNYNDIQTITKFVDQSKINAYDYSLYGLSYPVGQVGDDSMILHLPGVSNQRRIEIIKQYKEVYDISN